MITRRTILKLMGAALPAAGIACSVPKLIVPGVADASELILPDRHPPIAATYADMTEEELAVLQRSGDTGAAAEKYRRATEDFEAVISWTVKPCRGELRDEIEGLIHNARDRHGATGFRVERERYRVRLAFKAGGICSTDARVVHVQRPLS